MLKIKAARVRWVTIVVAATLGGVTEPASAEEITLKSSSDVVGCQKGEGRVEYNEFLALAATHLQELDALFYSDASTLSDPGQVWTDICGQAVTHINQKGLAMAMKHAVGGTIPTAARDWFDGLLKFWANLQIKGKKAYMAKVKLDQELAHRKKSIKQNATLKADYWEALQELDEAYGDATEFVEAPSAKARAEIRKRLDSEYVEEDFIKGFKVEWAWAVNHTDAAKGGKAAVDANMKRGDLKTVAKDLDGLENCFVKGEEAIYGSFVRTRNEWDAAIDGLYEEYETQYKKWLKELDWLFKDQSFKSTTNLRGCTWLELGTWFANMKVVVEATDKK